MKLNFIYQKNAKFFSPLLINNKKEREREKKKWKRNNYFEISAEMKGINTCLTKDVNKQRPPTIERYA